MRDALTLLQTPLKSSDDSNKHWLGPSLSVRGVSSSKLAVMMAIPYLSP